MGVNETSTVVEEYLNKNKNSENRTGSDLIWRMKSQSHLKLHHPNRSIRKSLRRSMVRNKCL